MQSVNRQLSVIIYFNGTDNLFEDKVLVNYTELLYKISYLG